MHRVGLDQGALHPFGSSTPKGEPIVVVVFGIGHELLLPPYEPGGATMAQSLFDFGQSGTDVTQ